MKRFSIPFVCCKHKSHGLVFSNSMLLFSVTIYIIIPIIISIKHISISLPSYSFNQETNCSSPFSTWLCGVMGVKLCLLCLIGLSWFIWIVIIKDIY